MRDVGLVVDLSGARHYAFVISSEKLAAFALMSAATSLVPGPSMLFILGEAAWRGGRRGAWALAGVQFGYIWWWFLAALGLGALALAFPMAFRVLALAGVLYLAWLGLQAIRHAGETGPTASRAGKHSAHAFRDGILVAMSNPKSLIYIVALLPPFVDAKQPIVPQLALLAVVAMIIDVAIGSVYILAGNGLAKAMADAGTRLWVDRSVGTIFLIISGAIFASILLD